MFRLILLVALGVAASYYFPDSRQMLRDAAAPFTDRMVRWTAREEMGLIADAVVEHERLTGEIPGRRDWLGWLNWRYPSDDSKKDPWGSIYSIQTWSDSVAIISLGPDRERNTEDDFRVTTPRERRR